MSIIHVNQIKNHIETEFKGHIDLSDVDKAHKENLENFFLTRALAAYAIKFLAGVSVEKAGKSIVDGGDDNGIDGICWDDKEKTLYLVQSKWIHDGKSEPSTGDLQKFFVGIRDLVNQNFEAFNEKVNRMQDDIKKALNDPNAKFRIIIVYTGINFSMHNLRNMEKLINELNDASNLVSSEVFNQSRLHDSLKIKTSGEPIDLMIGLKEWGKKESPHKAFYGQVSGLEISEWWQKFNNRLFAKNIRELIGDTEVNKEMRETIEKEPENFWYYNNGITIVCKKVVKTMLGGADNAFGQFQCNDISIVNGAQTVGTIGKYGQFPDSCTYLGKIYIPLRIISLESCDEEFGKKITRNNNRQNKIENRDFVALDPVQQVIQTELAIEGISYSIMRSENDKKEKTSFDIVESTTALACAARDISLAVQLKREIGKLWEDIDKAPYKILFNPSVSGIYIWRCVQIQREIEGAINHLAVNKKNRENCIIVHGSRIISHLIFKELNLSNLKDPAYDFQSYIGKIEFSNLVEEKYDLIYEHIKNEYGLSCMIPQLFANKSKCTKMVEEITRVKNASV